MILAIETATDVCGVALVHEGGVVAERSVVEKKIHSEKLLPMIDEVLRGASMNLGDVGAVAVSIGPGSFTGLRIGLSTAKGLAMARRIPIVPVPTLDAMAFEYLRSGGAHEGETVCPLIDAKRDEAYFSFYTVSGAGVSRKAPYEIAGVSKISDAARAFGIVTFIGDGTGKMEADGKAEGSFRITRYAVCSAASVGLLAESGAGTLAVGEFGMLEPKYVRDFVATQPGVKRHHNIQRIPVEFSQITHSSKD